MVTIVKKGGVRNLTKTIAVVSLLAPASGHPLGIGEIKLRSALNQNLDADIALVMSAGENIDDIKVKLAPPDKFDEAGVQWTSFLSKIKFEPVASANGSVVIKLSSKEAVKEPFLDFLLEVSWPKGSLYREFTVLVDPPSVYKEATIPVPTNTEYSEAVSAVVASRPSQASERESFGRQGEYGPTRRNDTLWHVAEQARPSGVSVKQMMIAIYEANPHAFYEENMYALTAGKTLKIPERDVVLKLSQNQAAAEFNRQTKAWKNRSTAPATAETTVAKTDEVNNQLTLIAPAEVPVAGDNVVVASEKEELATSENKADNAPQKTPEAVDSLDGASEDSAGGTVSADDALQSKVAALEKQMAMMQELIALKDQQLAALQNQSKVVPAGQAISGDVAVSPVDQSKPVAQPAVQPAPKESDSSSSYYLTVGGVGAGVLALLGWLRWRKRKVDEESDVESLFASSVMVKMPEVDKKPPAPIAGDSAVYGGGTVAESSFLGEFTPSDSDLFETERAEIDPISEADVYLAYGSYQQAEELIRQAIKDQPDRNECKLKLLEIFYANENKKAFEDYANELAKAGKKTEVEFWAKVAEMGREICPGSGLFSSGDALFAETSHIAVENVIAGNESDAGKISSEAASFAEPLNDDFAGEAAKIKDSVLDFDLTSLEVEDGSFIDEDEPRNNEAIEFDLSPFSMDAEGSIDETDKDVAQIAYNKKEQDIESYEFNFDADSNKAETKKIGEFDLIVAAGESHQDFDFLTDKSLDMDSDSSGGDFDFNFDLDFDLAAAGSSEQSSNQHEGFGVADLTNMDELETKLDLAKAYIDMGDTGAAKVIAREVLGKGTAEQKKTAQSLLDELS